MTNTTAPDDIALRPIGFVTNAIAEVRAMRDEWAEIVSEVRVAPEFAAGLEGLAGFSHVVILFWMGQVSAERRRVSGAPAGGASSPPAGTFALRTPSRPNPIGVTTVQLMGIRDNVLSVKGLDAVDGTAVLDIKPYSTRHDVAVAPVLPDWAQRLW